MNTIKITRNAQEMALSKTAATLFSDYFTMNEREIKKYSRAFLQPVFATNEPLKVVNYVLPFDPSTVEVITKTYDLGENNKVTIQYKKASYKEVDQQGRTETVTYLVPLLKTDQLMKLRWQLNELNADLEPISIAERAKSAEFQDLDIRDENGMALTGYGLADEYLGVPTGNAVVDAKKNEISSVKRINHATNVMNFERKKNLYKALYDLVSSPDKIKRTEGIESLSKLGVDMLQVNNQDTVASGSQPVIQGLTGGYTRYNPAVNIQPTIDSSVVGTVAQGLYQDQQINPQGPTPVNGVKPNMINKNKK